MMWGNNKNYMDIISPYNEPWRFVGSIEADKNTLNNKIQELYKLLYRGVIASESDFLLYYKYCDDKATAQDMPLTTTMRIHLEEGYCEIDVRENPFYKYSSSATSFYEHREELPIRFYNYYDQEIYSFEVLQWRHIETAQRRLEREFLGKIMTIEELDELCDNEDYWRGGMNYENFLDEGFIFYKYYFIDEQLIKVAWLHFDVLGQYTPLESPEEFERLKDVRVCISKVTVV